MRKSQQKVDHTQSRYLSNGKFANGCGSDQENGEFDNLISVLRTGDVFGEDLIMHMTQKRRKRSGTSSSTLKASALSFSGNIDRERTIILNKAQG